MATTACTKVSTWTSIRGINSIALIVQTTRHGGQDDSPQSYHKTQTELQVSTCHRQPTGRHIARNSLQELHKAACVVRKSHIPRCKDARVKTVTSGSNWSKEVSQLVYVPGFPWQISTQKLQHQTQYQSLPHANAFDSSSTTSPFGEQLSEIPLVPGLFPISTSPFSPSRPSMRCQNHSQSRRMIRDINALPSTCARAIGQFNMPRNRKKLK